VLAGRGQALASAQGGEPSTMGWMPLAIRGAGKVAMPLARLIVLATNRLVADRRSIAAGV
jgi:hypothetical protein